MDPILIDLRKLVRNPEHSRMRRNVLNDVLNGDYTPAQADIQTEKLRDADDRCFIGKGRYDHGMNPRV